ncbi:hypothetical protein Cgig2_009045 [Carnegiea gigantea]|uniref:Uncharacterized protein n=1 Tax=Carnegiea gigantea TaxID=171969 RepID=A0A9Q1JP97_9CARY|nr:hypothetical protein Cgig2_009045 [Carnegiea gigantea]
MASKNRGKSRGERYIREAEAKERECEAFRISEGKSAKMFRFRKSLDKHILQQPCDQNANHIQPHSQHHYLPVDDQGKVLRMQKMSMKDVYKLLGDGQFTLVPPDLENFFEVKKYCGAKLIAELWEKFSMPYTSEMDKVVLDKFGSKYRRGTRINF